MRIDFHHALCSIATALDFVGIDDVYHGKRVGIIAMKIAEYLDWPQEEQRFIMYAGFIHDCGVSSDAEHRHLINELQWSGSEAHCNRGSDYLKEIELLADFSPVVKYHHTPWRNINELQLPERTKLRANLIFLADRIDVQQAGFLSEDPLHDHVLLHRDQIISLIKQYSGSLFYDDFVSAFSDLASTDGFWFRMNQHHIDGYINRLQDGSTHELDIVQIKRLALLIAQIIDAKSPYTMNHSRKVAQISKALAKSQGYAGDHLQQLELAALLHDAGKLRSPDSILEKPSELTAAEFATMKHHTVDSEYCLVKMFPENDIAKWASMHHERLDGSGYPYSLTEGEIPEEARIIMIADIFQAMAQDRPYRKRLELDQIRTIMNELESSGRIDSNIYRLIKANAENYYSMAIS